MVPALLLLCLLPVTLGQNTVGGGTGVGMNYNTGMGGMSGCRLPGFPCYYDFQCCSGDCENMRCEGFDDDCGDQGDTCNYYNRPCCPGYRCVMYNSMYGRCYWRGYGPYGDAPQGDAPQGDAPQDEE